MAPTTVADPAYYTAAMSYNEWKREVSLAQVLFRPQLPYRKPEGAVARFFWRKRLWLEVTFALSMLEPWEKILVSECHVSVHPSSLPRPAHAHDATRPTFHPSRALTARARQCS